MSPHQVLRALGAISTAVARVGGTVVTAGAVTGSAFLHGLFDDAAEAANETLGYGQPAPDLWTPPDALPEAGTPFPPPPSCPLPPLRPFRSLAPPHPPRPLHSFAPSAFHGRVAPRAVAQLSFFSV